VAIVTLSDSVDHDNDSYPFAVTRLRRGMFKPWRFFVTVATVLRQGRSAGVIYANGLFLETAIANLFLRKPLVQKVVGDWAWERATSKGWTADTFDDFQEHRHGFKVGALKALRSFCAKRANAVIVPSRYLANAVARWGVRERCTVVIYNSAELPPLVCQTIPLATRFNIVTVGRLVPWKQIDRLIQVLNGCDEIGLVIVGDGPERERLERLALENHVADRIFFAGQRSKEETFGLMAACDVFVLNSTYEGFPHVVLEAMCAGLPVVATEVGGTAELVRDGENGLLISPNANGALASRLRDLLFCAEERQRLAAGGRETMRRFQWSVMVDATEALLRARSL
jgi:glycosyltransferase involved in cell wall biosynthesis